MSELREELEEALCRYATETLTYAVTVRDFCARSSKWMLGREKELDMMMDVKTRADKIHLGLDHVTEAEDKAKAAGEYLSSMVSMSADSRWAELEEELGTTLETTLQGLKELDSFSDAVEKLAVTSHHVFQEENGALRLPADAGLDYVQVVVIAARIICPLLLDFKRDASAFFLPRLHNIEVLAFQLDRYIQTTQKICDNLMKSLISDFDPKKSTVKVAVELDPDLPEDDVKKMLDHIAQLDAFRMNPNFRMVFLFQDELCSSFIQKFKDRYPRMLKFLEKLEDTAVQLDRMNKGARISSVVGSSVGAVGGILSIVGLALIPVTAGVSLALTMTGLGMGIGSGANSLITTATEIGVNKTQQNRANELFKSFMEDVEDIQGCLEDVIAGGSTLEMVIGAGKILCRVGSIGKAIDSIIDSVSAIRLLKNEEAIVGAGKVVAGEVKSISSTSRLASDVPDIGQAVAKGPLALTKSARAGLIAVNALFVGLDVFFICKDSISLAKGSETVLSQFIRARAALWSSEIDAWEKIHDCLTAGQPGAKTTQALLDQLFYPELE